MKTIDVRITDEQLRYLIKKAGRRSVVSVLSEMVDSMLDGCMWMDEHKEEVDTNGKITTD